MFCGGKTSLWTSNRASIRRFAKSAWPLRTIRNSLSFCRRWWDADIDSWPLWLRTSKLCFLRKNWETQLWLQRVWICECRIRTRKFLKSSAFRYEILHTFLHQSSRQTAEVFASFRMTSSMRRLPGLVNHDHEHKDEIDSEHPEQKHFCDGEAAAGDAVFRLGGDQLVGFERGDNRGKIFRADVSHYFAGGRGVGLRVHLLPS